MQPTNNKLVYLIGILLTAQAVLGQNNIRVGLTQDFKEGTVQTFTVDFNRTERVEENDGDFFLFTSKGYYLLPSADVNLGKEVSSSENNIVVQLKAGKTWFGTVVNGNGSNFSVEVNPTSNVDKAFKEQLYYGNIKFMFHTIKSDFNQKPMFVKQGSLFSVGPLINVGGRNSETYKANSLYLTAGLLTEYSWTSFKNKALPKIKPYADWQVKVSGKYYRVIKDVEALYADDWAGNMKISASKHLLDQMFYLSLTYKYGNDNPTYSYVNTLELGLKINLKK